MDSLILLGMVLTVGTIFAIQQRTSRRQAMRLLLVQRRMLDLETAFEQAQKERAVLVAANEEAHEATRTDMQAALTEARATRRLGRSNLRTARAMQKQIATLTEQLNTVVMAAVSSAFALRNRGTHRDEAMTYIEQLNTGGGGASVGGTVTDNRKPDLPRPYELGDPP